MIRTAMLAIVITAVASAAFAQPASLDAAQLDRVTAGTLTLTVFTPAVGHVPSTVTLPAPLGTPTTSNTLTVGQAADVAITINAMVHPAMTTITHP